MEAPVRTLRRKKSKRFKCITVGVVILLVVIIAIVVPLAVVLPRRKHPNGLPSVVLFPLYIYPESGAWDPLFQAITSHPKVDFTVVINPDSGPGSSEYPNEDYSPQIQRLNTYSNVRTIGYVRTGYAARNITSVLRDVATYAGWDGHPESPGIGLQGIFFDEVAHEYSEDAANYLKTINEAVKNASGLLANKMIIHNPGVIPDSRLEDPNTDVTVIFEQSYQKYKSLETGLQSVPQNRSKYSYVVHSLPENMDKQSLKDYVNDLSRYAKYLFVTDLSDGYYQGFGDGWKTFMDVFPF